MTETTRNSVRLALIAGTILLCGPPAIAEVGDEEFVGPFSSWRDLKRHYGAVGDGKADDTNALRRALGDLIKHEEACVLFIPAGTYRLTDTVKTVRKAHTDCQGVTVVGEDPARTVLRWAGPEGGTMLQWDAWYSKISRLTFDGAGRAATGLLYGPAFSTYNETSDITFRDMKAGLVFGGPKTHGQAENEVLRCRFLRCETGVQTVNWNSMDIWVWYCRFEDCGRGIYNVMGNWHAWQNLFLRSRIADVGAMNLMAFSVVNNTSVGSKCFFDFGTGHTWGSPVSLTGNRILDPTGDWAVALGNAGPYLVVDNTFRLAGETRGVRMTWADQTLVGNTYTKKDAVEQSGRFRRIEERVVAAKDIPVRLPALPPTPPRRERKVFD
ncbi:MAG: glycosyl hydrolase family 28-related protein, partial [Phycisphaerae bacterium]